MINRQLAEERQEGQQAHDGGHGGEGSKEDPAAVAAFRERTGKGAKQEHRRLAEKQHQRDRHRRACFFDDEPAYGQYFKPAHAAGQRTGRPGAAEALAGQQTQRRGSYGPAGHDLVLKPRCSGLSTKGPALGRAFRMSWWSQGDLNP